MSSFWSQLCCSDTCNFLPNGEPERVSAVELDSPAELRSSLSQPSTRLGVSIPEVLAQLASPQPLTDSVVSRPDKPAQSWEESSTAAGSDVAMSLSGFLAFHAVVCPQRFCRFCQGTGQRGLLVQRRCDQCAGSGTLAPRLWDGARLGNGVNADQDARTIRRQGAFSTKPGLCKDGAALVVAVRPARSFKVIIRRMDSRWHGCLQVGFTTANPNKLLEPLPNFAEVLPETWWLPEQDDEAWGTAARPGRVLTVSVVEGRLLRARFDRGDVFELPLSKRYPEDADFYPMLNVCKSTLAVELIDLDA